MNLTSRRLASAASSTSTFPAAPAARFQKALDDTRAQAGFPGAIAEVISPDGTWIGTAGTAGPGSSAPPTQTDRARIGSLTKTMTATVLLQLVQEHKLSLDDTIGSMFRACRIATRRPCGSSPI